MASHLIVTAPCEAENSIEASFRDAFQVLLPQLRPPFSLTIPTQLQYFNLNRAILYGILCEPNMALVHIKHLHGIVNDGYSFFTSKLVEIVNELYPKLVHSVRVQMVWITLEMIHVSAEGIDALLVSLLRQIVGGDFSEGNLWLCSELINLFLTKWEVLLDEVPLVLTSALYSFLRLLADHYRVTGNSKMEVLKQMEISFCVRVLREHFHLCLKIGRDLIRLLQDLVHIPEFRLVWKDLLLDPSKFSTPGFLNILQLYRTRTSSKYFLLRITPEMETQLRFLLTHVKLGNQIRYQFWFSRKFLCSHERETLVIDMIRFICCSHHPPNKIILSDITPRWAVIGWLLKSCRKNYVEANAKLALFYDWLFFKESMDNIMNIEPAILLMVHSIPQYIDITHMLLDFLFLLVDNYDVARRDTLIEGVVSSFNILVRKGVIQSLDVLTSCDTLSPLLKERLMLLLVPKVSNPLALSTEITDNNLEKMFHNLDKIMVSSVNGGVENESFLSPDVLACKIAKELEQSSYKLFDLDEDSFRSPTNLIIRFFIFSKHERILDLLFFWSRKGFLVGPCLLSYASRLAHEEIIEPTSMFFVKFHIENSSSNCETDKELVGKLVYGAFDAYKCYITHTKKILHEGSDKSLAKLISYDLMSFLECGTTKKFLKLLLCCIFYHLPDLAIGEEDIIKILIYHLDDADLLDMQFWLGLKKLSLFGCSADAILGLIKSSFDWGCVEQYKFWGLIRSELAVSEDVQIEKIVLETFCRDENLNSIAVNGLLSLCCTRAPNLQLVGAIMLLPNDKYPKFAAAVLANWAVSNQSLLFSSFAEFLEKLKNWGASEIIINHSAVNWLVNFLDAQGLEGENSLSKLCVNILDIKSMHPS